MKLGIDLYRHCKLAFVGCTVKTIVPVHILVYYVFGFVIITVPRNKL